MSFAVENLLTFFIEPGLVHTPNRQPQTFFVLNRGVDKAEVIPRLGLRLAEPHPLSRFINRGTRTAWRTAKTTFICT